MSNQNFFALIKDDNGAVEVNRIRVQGVLQDELSKLFNKQYKEFMTGIDTEIQFNGDWKPDSNEVLVLENVAEAKVMVDAINANASSFHALQLSKFKEKPIKAIFTGLVENGKTTVYVQKFSSRQALSLNEIPIIKMQTGNTFVKATEDIFTLDTKLVSVIIDNNVKFKSFHNARMVFELSQFYQEATDTDLNAMCKHPSLEVANVDEFIANADSQVRKMIHTISATSLFDKYSVNDIQAAAKNFPNLSITVNNGKLVLPTNKPELKDMLHFLLEDIYKGPLSGSDYLTNSKRKR